MQNAMPTRRRKSYWTNVTMALFILVVLALVLWNLPRGYSADLTQIGKGKNIVVQVHDHYLVDSTRLMENLNKLRVDYAGTVEFIVADLHAPEGQAFSRTQDAEATTLLFFAPDGTLLGRTQGVPELDVLRSTLHQIFRLPPAINREPPAKQH